MKIINSYVITTIPVPVITGFAFYTCSQGGIRDQCLDVRIKILFPVGSGFNNAWYFNQVAIIISRKAFGMGRKISGKGIGIRSFIIVAAKSIEAGGTGQGNF